MNAPDLAPTLDRRAKLLGGVDLARSRGAEIGPLDRPLVEKSAGAVLYVDYADAETLRRNHAGDPAVRAEAIVVDAVWQGRTLTEAVFGAAPPPPDARLHYVVASHVIEHVPDLVAWLVEVKAVLQPDGELRLAIPDCRYSFDYLRRESNLADVLAAFIQGDRVPSVRAVLDHCLHVAEVRAADVWAGREDRMAPKHPFSFARCLEAARDRHQNQGYYPVHCWTFTPASFATICQQLADHDLLDFGCVRWFDTERNHDEFFVVMRPEADREARAASWAAMASQVRRA